MAEWKIGDVLDELMNNQKERLASSRGVTVNGLAKSYGGDWVALIRDMTAAELARSLFRLLDEDDLRVVALRMFDGRKTNLDTISWNDKGVTRKRNWTAQGVANELFHWTENVTETRWRDHVAPRLREAGIESVDTPSDGGDRLHLRRIFFRKRPEGPR